MVATKRTRLSLEGKMDVIKYVKSGNSQKGAAEKFRVSRPAVVKMVKEAPQIETALSMGGKAQWTRINNDNMTSAVDEILHRWQVRTEIDAPTINITGEVLQ